MIGEIIYRFDINRRQYLKASRASGRIFGDIIYEHHFEPYRVVGETAQSWKCKQLYSDRTLSTHVVTVNKKTMIESNRDFNYRYYTETAKHQNIWMHENRGLIEKELHSSKVTYTQLKQIAKILGVE